MHYLIGFIVGIITARIVMKMFPEGKQDIKDSIADFINRSQSIKEETKTKLLNELRRTL